jgi:DNA-binding NarL/FixJ family response regulator
LKLKKILVVDDSPLVRDVIRKYLESRTLFTVCGEAINGVDAIQKAEKLNPDLVLMDFSMPVMNGIECASVLKVTMPKVPVVIYTSHSRAMIEPHARAVGVRGVIEKHDLSDLAGQLRQILH